VTGVFPDKIDVELALLTSKKVPVVIQVGGDPPSGFTMSDPKPKETTTVVSGARESVDAVKQAVGSIDVTGRTDSISQAVRLEPRDENGTLVERVKLEPALTNVEIKIDQIVFSRPVVVSPVITGAPERGYSIVGESVEPATVTISGPRQFIEEIKSIATKPVNVDGEKDDVVKGVSLDLPEGVDISVIGGVNVTVTVKIDPGTGEVHFGVPVTAIGVGDGLAVQGTLPSVEVAITGSLPDLLRLKSSDISATVDLSGEDQGTHTVKVKITLPQGISAQRVTVTPEQIEVSLGNL